MLQKKLRLHLEQFCSEQNLRSWFEPLEIVFHESNQRIDVYFPHAFFGAWFTNIGRHHFEKALTEVLGAGYSLHYYVTGNIASTQLTTTPYTIPSTPDFGAAYQFSTFIVNRKNTFPLTVAQEVAKAEKKTNYNPLIICGENGSGKTHLIKAIANKMARTLGSDAILYQSIVDFEGDYTNAPPLVARQHRMQREVLILDDLHLIIHKPHLHEELTYLVDHFLQAQKQLIFACNGGIALLKEHVPALHSRLEVGVVLGLKEPDIDVRMRFIQTHCTTAGLRLTREQMLLVAQHCMGFRTLNGMLLKIKAYRDMIQRDILNRELDHILQHTENGTERATSFTTILHVVSDHYAVTPADIQGNKRHQQVVTARQMAMFLCRELLGSSFPSLGRLFGGKDHSTVMYSVKKMQQIQSSNKDIHILVTELKRKCITTE